ENGLQRGTIGYGHTQHFWMQCLLFECQPERVQVLLANGNRQIEPDADHAANQKAQLRDSALGRGQREHLGEKDEQKATDSPPETVDEHVDKAFDLILDGHWNGQIKQLDSGAVNRVAKTAIADL